MTHASPLPDLATYQDPEGRARFRSIDVELPLSEVFAGVEFKGSGEAHDVEQPAE